MTTATAKRPHRLAPRAGRWVRVGASGLGPLRCDVCDVDFRHGWGFRNAGQQTTTSAHVCDGCADSITNGGK